MRYINLRYLLTYLLTVGGKAPLVFSGHSLTTKYRHDRRYSCCQKRAKGPVTRVPE